MHDLSTKLRQAFVWVTPEGRARPIASMTHNEAAAARDHLDDQAETLANALATRLLDHPDQALSDGPDTLSEADKAIADPLAWIASTTLARALDARATDSAPAPKDPPMRSWFDRLHDGDTWYGTNSEPFPIAEMDPRHVRNVLIWIDRQHEGIVAAAAAALESVPYPPFHTGAYDMVAASAEHEAAAMRANPRAWLAETPLVQALADRLSNHLGRHRALSATS